VISRAAKIIVCAAVAVAAWCGDGKILASYVISPTYPPGLAEHLNEQLESRTNGNVTSDFTGPTDGSNYWQAQPTNKPNFWLLGVTNIFAQSQIAPGMSGGLPYLTAIAPHFCVCANHVFSGNAHLGEAFVWIRPDGSYYTNATVASANITNTDIQVVLMAQTNWTICKVLPDISAKVPFLRSHDVYRFTPPVFVRFHQGIGRTNQFHSTFVSAGYSMGLFPSGAGYNPAYPYSRVTFGDYSKGDCWVSGDSSGAAFAIINGEAVLLGTAYTATYCPPLGLFTNEINAAMATLCASNGLEAETLTICDLSAFPDL
jgi:hypothetical protein